jgi:pimeloyl-ACP methyl ester carboxylesterase
MKLIRSFILPALLMAGVLLMSAPLFAADSPYAPIMGTWTGNLAVMGQQVRLAVNLSIADDGSLKATLDSPDQGVSGIPVDACTFEGGVLKLDLKSIGGNAAYEGTLDTAADEFKGQWKQSGMTFELNLKRAAGPVKDNRPQEPKEPFPYKAEDVTYSNARSEGVTLAATLTIPEGEGPFPAVVLITGSGAEDRNETLMGHKPFLVIADYLTRQGIAVLRADDRGVGGSTGDYQAATSEDFATDALAGVDYLLTRPEIDAKHIGLIGHSEGGIIGPLAAVQSKDVAFVVLLAGPGVDGKAILFQQSKDILRAMGASEEQQKAQPEIQERIFNIVLTEKDPKVAEPKLRALMEEVAKKQPDAQKLPKEQLDSQINAQVMFVNSPWFRFFLTYDPAPTLSRLQIPVLAVNGSLDLQVNAAINLPAIEDALKDGGNKDFTIKEFPGLNHLFQHAKTGTLAEYSQIEETFSEEAMAFIADWIKAHTGK